MTSDTTTAAVNAASCHHRRRSARRPATAIRAGRVTYTSPRMLKTLAITVSGGVRPATISRSHPSSSRWMLVSVPWSPTAAKTPAVSSTATVATAASRPGAASSAGRSGPGTAGQLIRDMRPRVRTAQDPRSAGHN